MKARTLYLIGIVVCLILFVFVSHDFYTNNLANNKVVYKAIVVDKYINKNTDGDSYIFSFKFKYQNDTLLKNGSVSFKDYDIYHLYDFIDIFYIPSAIEGDEILVKSYLKDNNKGVVIFISLLIIFILILIYKLKTADANEYFFMEDD